MEPARDDARQPEYNRDEDQVGLLTVFYFVMAGLHLMGCAAGGVHVFLAVFIPQFIESIPPGRNPPPPELAPLMATLFGFIGVALICISTLMAALTAYAGRCLQQRRSRTFVIVIAALHLVSMPFGTALGVFTIILLSRPSVAAWFEQDSRRPSLPRDSHVIRS